jgi:lipid II:glycine glycyltransferase (peptidoglycan interpeptide bridge formation enzyme)
VGWSAVRLIARKERRIVAGAQVLFKPLGPETAVGYVPKGPVFGRDDPGLRKGLLAELSRLAQRNRIGYLVMQPPRGAAGWLEELPALGFRPSAAKMGPVATVLLDLSLDEDTMLAEMKARTRYNVRLSSRRGITVREGAARDLDMYCELVEATSRRQQFPIYPSRYFTEMWRVFEPQGQIKLFLAEHMGEVVSAQLAVGFGDTVVNKLSVWSGAQAARKPNEAVQWYAICWAKAHGYRYFDLEGIEPQAASAALRDEPIPSDLQQSVTSFKLGFGGKVLALPGVYDHIYDQSLRDFYDRILTCIGAFAAGEGLDLQV